MIQDMERIAAKKSFSSPLVVFFNNGIRPTMICKNIFQDGSLPKWLVMDIMSPDFWGQKSCVANIMPSKAGRVFLGHDFAGGTFRLDPQPSGKGCGDIMRKELSDA